MSTLHIQTFLVSVVVINHVLAQGTPSQVVKNFRVTKIDDQVKQVTLQWDPVPEEAFNGIAHGYVIQLCYDINCDKQFTTIPIEYTNQLKTEILIDKCLIFQTYPKHTYFARIALVNGDGHKGPYSDVIEVKTFECEVQSFAALTLGSTAFLLRWEPSLYLRAYITGYNIYCEEIDGDTTFEQKITVYGAHSQQIELSGLKANTKYRLSIAATINTNEGKRFSIETKTGDASVSSEKIGSINGNNIADSEQQDVQINKKDVKLSITPLIATEGSIVKLCCKIPNDINTAVVQWFYKGKEFFPYGNFIEMSLYNVRIEHAGEYICRVGELYEGRNSLFVIKRTSKNGTYEQFKVRHDGTITLPCNANDDASIKVETLWIRNNEKIDYQNECRYSTSSNHSLIISNTTQMDEGPYDCIVIDKLDTIQHSAVHLIVQNIPNAPKLIEFECFENEIHIGWQTDDDINAPIQSYTIERNTEIPSNWQCYNMLLDCNQTNYRVPFNIPWVNSSLRVIAHNEVGSSPPSESSEICRKPADYPNENPEDVEGNGNESKNLAISWTPMPQIKHHGPGFHYRVSWKRDDSNETWNMENIMDWQKSRIIVSPQSTFDRYRVKVEAYNEIGKSTANATEIIIDNKQFNNIPDMIQSFHAFPLGSSAFLLRWKLPTDQINGYYISYREINEPIDKRMKKINDRYVNQTKIIGLKPNTEYRLYIVAYNNAGSGKRKNIAAKTNAMVFIEPNRPSFRWELINVTDELLSVKVTWLPCVEGNPGTDFITKYRLRGETQWISTGRIVTEDFVVIQNLLTKETYEMYVESVEGKFVTGSQIGEVSQRQNLQNPFDHPDYSRTVILGLTATILSLFLVFTLIYLMCRRCHQTKLPNVEVIESRDKNFCVRTFEEGNINGINPELTLDEQADLLPYDPNYEFRRENLKLGQQLGTGAFGVVFKATAKGIVAHEAETTVAVKTVKSIGGNEVLRALALELKILIYLGKHLNVVNLLGAITENIAEHELMLIVEYCPYGNLRSFLVDHREQFIDQIDRNTDKIDPKISTKIRNNTNEYKNCPKYVNCNSGSPVHIATTTSTDLLCWAFQVARGMNYLASRKVLHGDLAARNILLCENNVVKICDFGLARSMYKTGDYHIKTQRALPIKWLALESISDQVFSTYSDVWSFGIVVWELFSLGATPYPGMSAGTALFLKLADGYRMEKPKYATQGIYEIMLACWTKIPERRPLFDELEERIANLMDRSAAEQYIILNEPYLKSNAISLDVNKTDYFALLGSPECQSPPIPLQHDTTFQLQPPDLIVPTTRLNSVSFNTFRFANNPAYDYSEA